MRLLFKKKFKKKKKKKPRKALNLVCILSPEKPIFYAGEEESLRKGRRQGRRRGGGEPEIYGPLKAAFLPSILPGCRGLQWWDHAGTCTLPGARPSRNPMGTQVLPHPQDLPGPLILHPPQPVRMFSLRSSHSLRFLRLFCFI